MKLVINECFGGFGISASAIKRMAELTGKECYFFTNKGPDEQLDFERHFPCTVEEADAAFMFSAFDIANPDEVIGKSRRDEDGTFTSFNALYSEHSFTSRPDDRTDALLIRVVEELGEKANGRCAKLKIVKIPDGIKWEIDNYDGNETVHEVHRIWR